MALPAAEANEAALPAPTESDAQHKSVQDRLREFAKRQIVQQRKLHKLQEVLHHEQQLKPTPTPSTLGAPVPVSPLMKGTPVTSFRAPKAKPHLQPGVVNVGSTVYELLKPHQSLLASAVGGAPTKKVYSETEGAKARLAEIRSQQERIRQEQMEVLEAQRELLAEQLTNRQTEPVPICTTDDLVFVPSIPIPSSTSTPPTSFPPRGLPLRRPFMPRRPPRQFRPNPSRGAAYTWPPRPAPTPVVVKRPSVAPNAVPKPRPQGAPPTVDSTSSKRPREEDDDTPSNEEKESKRPRVDPMAVDGSDDYEAWLEPMAEVARRRQKELREESRRQDHETIKVEEDDDDELQEPERIVYEGVTSSNPWASAQLHTEPFELLMVREAMSSYEEPADDDLYMDG